MSTRIDPFEKKILEHLRFVVNNRNLKIDHLLEWSSDEATVDKNLRDGETKVHLTSLGIYCAIPNDQDKRP